MQPRQPDTIIRLDNKADLLPQIISEIGPDGVVVVCDTHTQEFCLPHLLSHLGSYTPKVISIEPGEQQKSLETVTLLWEKFYDLNLSRKTLIILLGGGCLLDIGGFAASTFKRGLPCINVPTTILAAVDAAVGGKRGFNFKGTKNIIGSFYPSSYVALEPHFFRTLPETEKLSGWAEILKHALLEQGRSSLIELLKEEQQPDTLSVQEWGDLIARSITTKQRIVEEDPYENGMRQMLNLGHTFGHALEAYILHKNRKELPHGFAVAAGIVMELYLSFRLLGFPQELLTKVCYYIRDTYPVVPFNCKVYDTLISYMEQDKKNRGNVISAALLKDLGVYAYGTPLSPKQCKEAMDFYRDLYNT
ncbi:MAG: 3-dehydroquinate synthase family protein [Porphyromonas sp.]|nr:3-dehydroquinate synthase family protein [Porphyromonas sp.]